jgi:preprotein translocase subunit SecD
MDRNLLWKLVLIIVLVVLAVIEVYPPSKTLNPGLDLAGGTSFIYELDTTGLKPEEQRNLAQRTIDVLRKRIDPTNTRNLIWRPQGNNRIEIQVPLASQETIQLRKQYEAALNALQSQNINLSNIMRSLNKPAEQRAADFAKYAHGSKERQEILDNLAKAYDERKALQQQRDQFAEKMADGKKQVQAAGLSPEMLESSAREWASAAPADREKKIAEFAGAKKELIPVITTYVQNFQKWADAANKLATPETGANAKYAKAMAFIHMAPCTAGTLNNLIRAMIRI